jgi:hypothetical protein
MKDYLFSLRTAAWRTAGARYNAARRLKRRELFSVVSLTLFSALSVAIAFLQRVYSPQGGTPLDNYLTALAACLGVFLLAVSLIEYGARHGAKADLLHGNAEDLTAFQQKAAQQIARLDSGVALTWGEVNGLREEGDAIKARCTENHAPVDDRLFTAQHRLADEFKDPSGKPRFGRAFAVSAWLSWSLASDWYFFVLWLVTIAATAYTYCFI